MTRHQKSALIQVADARKAFEIADTGFVLVQGRNRFADTGASLMADPDVRRSFLGG
jgi:branched-chain amino acid transport system ATP-binding protein